MKDTREELHRNCLCSADVGSPVRCFGEAGRTAGVFSLLPILLALLTIPAFCGDMTLEVGGRQVNLSFDEMESVDPLGEDAVLRISGNPASVTAELEEGVVVFLAPNIAYEDQVIHATAGVHILKGTFELTADSGFYSLSRDMAQFEGDVRWKLGQGEKVRQGVFEQLTLYFENGDIRRMNSGKGTMGFPLPRDGAGGFLQEFGQKREEELPVPEVQRAVAPLEK